MGKQRCDRVRRPPLLWPISEGTSVPPRPVPPGFAQMGVRLWLALPRFGGRERQSGWKFLTPCINARSAMVSHLSTPRQGLGSEAKGRSAAVLGGPEAQQGGQVSLQGSQGTP